MKFQNRISRTKRDRRKIQTVYYLGIYPLQYIKIKIVRNLK